MPRMRILTASEQETFDRPPVFDHRERKQYFSFPEGLMDIAATLRSPISQIGFLLMCGYFKATIQSIRDLLWPMLFFATEPKIMGELGVK